MTAIERKYLALAEALIDDAKDAEEDKAEQASA